MGTAEVEEIADVEMIGAATIANAWDSIRALSAKLGVPPINELMAEIDTHVLEVYGPVPATPTWDEVVAAWNDRQDDVVEAEIVEDEPTAEVSAKTPVAQA